MDDKPDDDSANYKNNPWLYLKSGGLLLVIRGRFELPTYRLGGSWNSYHLPHANPVFMRVSAIFSSILNTISNIYNLTYSVQIAGDFSQSFTKFSRKISRLPLEFLPVFALKRIVRIKRTPLITVTISCYKESTLL